MSGGGSGGSGTQKYEWNDQMKQPWANALSYAEALKDKPYNPYPYQRIADINGDQSQSMDLIRQGVLQGGTGAGIAANNQAEQTLRGDYLNGPGANPYAGQQNQYAGMDNPFFTQQLQTGMQDLAQGYQRGTAADTTRMFNAGGAFGTKAHQDAIANNEAGFGKTLNNYLSGMQNEQYSRSAGLEDARLNRGTGAFEGERGRMIGSMGAGQNSNQQFLQGANALMGVGDIQRGFSQDQLNQYFNDWQQQQNYPASQLDYYTGILGRAQGGIAPNQITQQSGYAASPYSQILGAGLLGYGMMK